MHVATYFLQRCKLVARTSEKMYGKITHQEIHRLFYKMWRKIKVAEVRKNVANDTDFVMKSTVFGRQKL